MSWVHLLPTRGTLAPSPPPNSEVPVLFLHGMLGSPGNFQPVAEELQRRNRWYIAPAYGNRATASFAQCQAEIAAAVADIDCVDIVAHSTGGVHGLWLAQHRPGLVRHLIGVGACFYGIPHLIRFPRLTAMILGPAITELSQPLSATIPEQTRVTSLISRADTIVPPSSSLLGEVRYLSENIRHEHLPQQVKPIIAALYDK